MEPLTEDQERMLRCWASTNGNRRPGKGPKAFLAQANGLSEEQVDRWYENFRSSKKNGESSHTMQSFNLVNGLSTDPDAMVFDNSLPNDPIDQSFLGNLDLGLDIDFGTTAFPSEAHTWSPMGVIHEEEDPTFPGPFEDGSQSNFWCPTVGSQRGFLRSSASSLTESCPLLSPSGGRHMSTSSYGSSLRTWESMSNPASVYDPSFEEPVIKDSEETMQTINPIDLSKAKPLPTSRFSVNQTIPKGGFSFQGNAHKMPKVDHDDAKGPPVPPKPGKGQGNYICTATTCQTPIAKKWDWARHENQHDPQGHWVCMLGNNPSIQTTAGWICVFCNDFRASREDINIHLAKEHRIQECTNKTSPFFSSRKDKLKQHLKQVHCLADDANGWEAWYTKAAPEKYAWGCGFCGACLRTWDGRIQHIAQHYEQDANIPKWSSSLVVQGLLMQAYPDFNVAEAWKALVGNSRDGDRLLKWEKRDADNLKRKLEFHEDTPAKIATEAKILAKVSGTVNGLAWTHSDSRVNTFASSISFGDIEKGCWRNTSSTTMSNGSYFQEPATQLNFGTPGDMSNLI